MPISIADFRARRATVTVESPLGPIDVLYRPSVMTLATEARIQDLSRPTEDESQAAANLRGLVDQFCRIVESVDITGPIWDEDGNEILDEHGNSLVPHDQLVPIDPEYVMYIPSDLMKLTFAAITNHATEEAEHYSKPSTNGAKPNVRPLRRGSFSQ